MPETNGLEQYIGRYARSVESGWLGKVVGIDGDYLRMQGVAELERNIAGGTLDEWLSEDDIQFFAPEDLTFLKVI